MAKKEIKEIASLYRKAFDLIIEANQKMKDQGITVCDHYYLTVSNKHLKGNVQLHSGMPNMTDDPDEIKNGIDYMGDVDHSKSIIELDGVEFIQLKKAKELILE